MTIKTGKVMDKESQSCEKLVLLFIVGLTRQETKTVKATKTIEIGENMIGGNSVMHIG